MFDNILALFSQIKGYRTALPEADAKTALGALLVRVAKADDRYLASELNWIDRILAARNGINLLQAAKLRAQCEKLEQSMPFTAQIIEVLNEVVSNDEREAMIAAMWQVVFADGLQHEAESDFLVLVQNSLGIDPEVSASLRNKAEADHKRGAGEGLNA